MVAIEQLEGRHLGRLRDLAGQFQEQGAGAAVAEVDHHMDVFCISGGRRRRTDADVHGGRSAEWIALDVEDILDPQFEILG